jgi:hypothetical protein
MTAPAPVLLAADELDLLESTVDAGLAAAIDALADLRARQAHLARGHDSWGSYLLERFGEALRRLRLDRDDHLAVVDVLARPHGERNRPAPVRAIAEVLGVSAMTAHNYKRELGLAPPAAPKVAPLPAPVGKVWQQAAEYLRRAEDGLTLVELAKVSGWTEGKASGALSDLVRVRHLAERTEDRRAGQRVHRLLPE